MRWIERERKRGHDVRRKWGPRPLGRGSIPGALSDVPAVSLGILNSLRHVRSISSMRLSCSIHMPLQFVILDNRLLIRPV